MSSFTNPLRIEQLQTDRRMWRIFDGFGYHVGSYPSKEIIRVKHGFVTDLQSIPGWSWSIIGHPLDDYAQSGAGHDYLYRYPADGVDEPRTRKRCDQIYLEMNKVLGCPWWKRTLKYTAVRIGGSSGWTNYRIYDDFVSGYPNYVICQRHKVTMERVNKAIKLVSELNTKQGEPV